MKKIVFVLIALLVGMGVIAGSGMWNFYAGNNPYSFFGLTPFEAFDIQVTNDNTIPEDKLVITEVIKPEVKLEPAVILITEKGFEPQVLNITLGQIVVWKNKQKTFNSIVAGVREADQLRSKTLEPNDYFTWNFSKEGEYDYVDVVLIGRTGKVIVG